ncbi:MAG: imidazole glycerol phosphate synthase subunit HisH [Cyanobacteria bacterium REEB417]|nr:imidazole glycerol phosphate synthase subunit HisH [Cyanobacteria bacterium REEB417]
MGRIGLIDYGMGNLHSVQRALERCGATVVPVFSVGAIEGCDALVLPGVGAFDPAMAQLHEAGLVGPLRAWCDRGGALLGICLGLQLLFEASDEGQAEGLGVFEGRVRALPRGHGEPVPHMGWERLLPAEPSPLMPGHGPQEWMYFVHSYAAVPRTPACTTAHMTFAGSLITAAVWQGSVGACQFHPEKSGPSGEAMLRRWLSWVVTRP